MGKMKILTACCLAGGLMLVPNAFAAGVETSIGLGVGMAPDYEGSDDYEAVPLPFARINWGDNGNYVLLSGNNVRANFLTDKWQLGPLLQFRAERHSVDNKKVKRMEDIDSAVEGGLFLLYKGGPWRFGLDAVTDISDEHDGSLVTLRAAYVCDNVENWKFTTTLSSTWADDDYMETYFQVDSKNVKDSGLSLYEANNGIKDVGLSFHADYSWNKSWSMQGIASYTQLVEDAKNSPVVDDEGDDGQMFLGVMAIYHFN
ncbi:MAG: MipA/OmpV family protein [Thermodesulfobacteriota bacterium]|nr:MipA/OmpV family protein [Thermodesulfobacteriota bacterium]